MSKLVVITYMSLDGVIQSPGIPDEDTSGGFKHGGWLVPLYDEVFGKVDTDWTRQAGCYLFGRRTYEILARHWPHIDDGPDSVAGMLNRMPKYVVSRTLESADWTNTTVLSGDAAEEISKLKSQDVGEIQVPGSGQLVQTLMRHDLVDEYRLLFFPVLLGSGKRLFAEGTVPSTLKLVDATISTTGVAIHTYQPTGALKVGSFALDQ